MRSRNAQITIAIVCLILGVMLAIQFKTQKTINESLKTGRVEELSQSLIEVTKQRDALYEEVQELRISCRIFARLTRPRLICRMRS